ncbi:MAG TPA: hypothetical protein VL527_17020 [Dongiaceae bacterium]|jgi:hypothetical protein|nr:hypothetical protein [Dongiaceae bacterium]
MNQNELQRKLIAAAQAQPPGDQVPYAFDQRIMARLRSLTVPDPLTLWNRALWRAAVSCLGVVLLVAASSFLLPATRPATTAANATNPELSQQLETTLLANVDQPANSTEETW